jgi:hypothetical protein
MLRLSQIIADSGLKKINPGEMEGARGSSLGKNSGGSP